MKRFKQLILSALLCVGVGSVGHSDTTTSKGLVKPTIGSPTWGGKINNNFDIIDSSFAALNGTNTYTADQSFNTVNIKSGAGINFYNTNNTKQSSIQNNGNNLSTNKFSMEFVASDGSAFNGLPFDGIDLSVYGGASSYGSFAVIGSSQDSNYAYSGFQATGPISQSTLWTLPKKDGLTNQPIVTDGSAHLSFLSLAANQCVQTDANGALSVSGSSCGSGGGGGGGASFLQVTKSGVQVTSPTASLNFFTSDFSLLGSGTTAFIALNPSSTDFIHNQPTLQSSMFNVSTGVVEGRLSAGLVSVSSPSAAGTFSGVSSVVGGSGGGPSTSYGFNSDANATTAAYGINASGTSGSGIGYGGFFSGTGTTGNSYGVKAQALVSNGYGGYFSNSINGGANRGIYGEALGGNGASAGTTNYAVTGSATGSGNKTANYAGYFDANGGANNYGIYVQRGQVAIPAPEGLSATYGVTVGTFSGAGLSTCGDSNHALSYTGGTFSCQALSGTGSSLYAATATASFPFGYSASTVAISQTGSNTAVLVTSTGTGNGIALKCNGTAGGALSTNDSGCFNLGVPNSATMPSDGFTIDYSSAVDAQLGVRPFHLITGPNFNDPNALFEKLGTNSGPNLQLRGRAQVGIEFVDTALSQNLTVPAGKYKFVTCGGGVDCMTWGSRNTANNSFQNGLDFFREGSTASWSSSGNANWVFKSTAAVGWTNYAGSHAWLMRPNDTMSATYVTTLPPGYGLANQAWVGDGAGNLRYDSVALLTSSPTFTSSMTVPSMTVRGTGDGEVVLTIGNSSYTVIATSAIPAVGHYYVVSSTWGTVVDGGLATSGGGNSSLASTQTWTGGNVYQGYTNLVGSATFTTSTITATSTFWDLSTSTMSLGKVDYYASPTIHSAGALALNNPSDNATAQIANNGGTGSANITLLATTGGVDVTGPLRVSANATVTGSLAVVPVKKTSNYSTTLNDSVIVASATASGLTITLNATTDKPGQILTISKVDKTIGVITIQVAGSDLISGTGTVKLNAFGQTASIISDGNGNWMPYGQGIQWTPDFVGPGFQSNTANTINTSSVPVCGSFSTQVPVAVDSITVHIGTNSGAMDVGIYDNSGNRLGSAGSTTGYPVGRANIPLSSTVQLPPGIYWMCLVSDNTTATFYSATASIQQFVGGRSCAQAVGNIPLPATLPFPCSNTLRAVNYDMWGHVVGGAL